MGLRICQVAMYVSLENIVSIGVDDRLQNYYVSTCWNRLLPLLLQVGLPPSDAVSAEGGMRQRTKRPRGN